MVEIRLDLAGAHQVDPRQKHPVQVEQGFDSRRIFLEKQLFLRLGETQIVMGMVAGVGGANDMIVPS
jgi:hypothetical protein